MKVYVLTGNYWANDPEDQVVVLGVYLSHEDGAEVFHALVDDQIAEGEYFNEGIEDKSGNWSHAQSDGGEHELRHWAIGDTHHCVDQAGEFALKLVPEEVV